jgi:16S rRNA (guanine966-N2)-methyltransferase
VRISGGDAKGITLKVPKGARPASEKVRQAVFSSIAAHVPDARVLDLYCGSGAYGLEALSRGADEAIFIDRDAAAVAAVRANAVATGASGVASVRRADVMRYLTGLRRRDGRFDLIFIDPPYGGTDVLEALVGAAAPLLAADGRVIVETRWGKSDPQAPPGLVVEADRRYGDTRVLVFSLGEP